MVFEFGSMDCECLNGQFSLQVAPLVQFLNYTVFLCTCETSDISLCLVPWNDKGSKTNTVLEGKGSVGK